MVCVHQHKPFFLALRKSGLGRPTALEPNQPHRTNPSVSCAGCSRRAPFMVGKKMPSGTFVETVHDDASILADKTATLLEGRRLCSVNLLC